jgi:hypothetical protein
VKEDANMKTKLSLSVVIALWLTFIVVRPSLAEKNYLAERFDVTIAVHPDGTLHITETIVFRFTGGPFTYVFRELAFNNLDEIDNIQASLDGQVLGQGTQLGQVEIITGKPTNITWHFVPTQDSVHSFTLTYRVKGAIRQDDAADTLIWRAIPAQHEYTINSGIICLDYPSGILPLAAPSISETGAGLETGPTGATFTLNNVDADTPVDVTASFPSRSLVSQPPAWQADQLQQARRTSMGAPSGLGAAGFTILLGVIGVILAGRNFRRETTIPKNKVYQSFSAPPRATPPALAAKLTGSGVPFLGTLFDLAQRGLIRIEEGPKKWGSRTFEVTRQPTSESLLPHEQIFLDALFKKARDNRVALSDIASLAYNNQFSQALDQELTAAGWRDAKRSSQRGRFLAAAVLAMALGIAVFFAGLLIGGLLYIMDTTAVVAGAILMGAGGAAFGVGLLALIVALSISTYSDEGVQLASAWNSFAGYLRNITRGREPVASPDLFERYLPYAAGLGLATEWAKFFQKQANVPIPEWFMGLQSGMEDGSFIAIMAAISSADSSASVATGGDGGGASGGGASGAG